MSKKEKKRKISEHIDLSNGRFTDSEVDMLHDLATNQSDYVGRSAKKKHSFDSFCSDGKYHRDETTTYTISKDNDRLYVKEDYKYQDDDGQSGGHQSEHTTGRAIVNLLKSVLKQ